MKKKTKKTKKTQSKSKRKVLTITWDKREGGWVVSGTRFLTRERYMRQADAVAAGVAECRALFKAGELAQLVLHGKDGRIKWERTYGKDPTRYPG